MEWLDGVFWFVLETVVLLVCLPLALVARYTPKKFDVGLGPEALINNIYHKLALQRQGYTVETFASATNFITSRYDHILPLGGNEVSFLAGMVRLFWFACSRYRVLYIYLNGGALRDSRFIWRLEPLLYRIARTRTVVMPYGGDVMVFTRGKNLQLNHAMTVDYPDYHRRKARVEGQIDLWTRYADHVVSGCDWVDYMYHWDTLMIAHFSVDTERLGALVTPKDETLPISAEHPLRLLHAPNHQAVKGTAHIRRAVRELAEEGVPVVLDLIEFSPNEVVLAAIDRADVVVDQIVIGWYALFSIESMALATPAICYLRPDLERLYVDAGLLGEGEVPLISATPHTIKETLRRLALSDRATLAALGRRSQDYVRAHHSLESVGRVFARINRSIDVFAGSGAAS